MHPAYKDNVLKHLQSKCPEMVIPFLERIIYDNNNNDDFDLDSVEYANQEQEVRISCLLLPVIFYTKESSSLNKANSANSQNSAKYKLLPLDENDNLPIIEEPSFADVNGLHTCYIISLMLVFMFLPCIIGDG